MDWLWLEFAELSLGPGDSLRLSTSRGAAQSITMDDPQYVGTDGRIFQSIIFDGDTVDLELFAAPGSRAGYTPPSPILTMPLASTTACGPPAEAGAEGAPRKGTRWSRLLPDVKGRVVRSTSVRSKLVHLDPTEECCRARGKGVIEQREGLRVGGQKIGRSVRSKLVHYRAASRDEGRGRG